MLDRRLRPYAGAILNPLVCSSPRWLAPTTVSLVGLASGLWAAYAASQADWETALWLFVTNRVLDGVDGLLARTREIETTSGAYVDFLADMIVYVAVPLGIASALDLWAAAAVLIATFAVNVVTWLYPLAPGAKTEVTGLIEGTETMVFFVAMLAVPDVAEKLMWLMALLVGATAIQRAGVTLVRMNREP